jgi:hypothetical protein
MRDLMKIVPRCHILAEDRKDSPPLFDAWPVAGALRFFTAQNAFLSEVASKIKSKQASFYYGRLQNGGLTREEGGEPFSRVGI